MNIFRSADILLPREEEAEKWAVIACDQFSSEPEYWAETARIVGDAPSALRLILPEASLGADDGAAAAAIHETMRDYLQRGVLREYRNAFVYVERTMADGSVRQGVVGMLDLEAYDYAPDAGTPVRATEETVRERIPPRMHIRQGAALELPHTLLLCDDREDLLIGLLGRQKAALPKLYDFELMQGGGHIAGWLLEGVIARKLRERLDAYAKDRALVFAVGDGNHSLATAKAVWETPSPPPRPSGSSTRRSIPDRSTPAAGRWWSWRTCTAPPRSGRRSTAWSPAATPRRWPLRPPGSWTPRRARPWP